MTTATVATTTTTMPAEVSVGVGVSAHARKRLRRLLQCDRFCRLNARQVGGCSQMWMLFSAAPAKSPDLALAAPIPNHPSLHPQVRRRSGRDAFIAPSRPVPSRPVPSRPVPSRPVRCGGRQSTVDGRRWAVGSGDGSNGAGSGRRGGSGGGGGVIELHKIYFFLSGTRHPCGGRPPHATRTHLEPQGTKPVPFSRRAIPPQGPTNAFNKNKAGFIVYFGSPRRPRRELNG